MRLAGTWTIPISHEYWCDALRCINQLYICSIASVKHEAIEQLNRLFRVRSIKRIKKEWDMVAPKTQREVCWVYRKHKKLPSVYREQVCAGQGHDVSVWVTESDKIQLYGNLFRFLDLTISLSPHTLRCVPHTHSHKATSYCQTQYT